MSSTVFTKLDLTTGSHRNISPLGSESTRHFAPQPSSTTRDNRDLSHKVTRIARTATG
jgi:hypothetical protein